MDVLADPSSTLVTPTPINVSRPSSPEAPSEKITGMKLIRLALRRPFHGILHDIRARAPFYASDFKDAWNYRVIPATAMIFFAKYARHHPTPPSCLKSFLPAFYPLLRSLLT